MSIVVPLSPVRPPFLGTPTTDNIRVIERPSNKHLPRGKTTHSYVPPLIHYVTFASDPKQPPIHNPVRERLPEPPVPRLDLRPHDPRLTRPLLPSSPRLPSNPPQDHPVRQLSHIHRDQNRLGVMATHVVVIHSSLRRATIKTPPGKYMSDVLSEACTKLGLKSDDYVLKYNKKPVDLTVTMRSSGLPAGAQLDLVQGSRSPSVVTIALQLPMAEKSLRLTDQFASNTTLWQILRQFESGRKGNTGQKFNFTERAVSQVHGAADSGSGRMYYEMPEVNVMGRSLGTLADLQKTLAQVGLGSGAYLLRLGYRNSGLPLEEAMAQISQFFKEIEEAAPAPRAEPSPSPATPSVQAPAASETQPATAPVEEAPPATSTETAPAASEPPTTATTSTGTAPPATSSADPPTAPPASTTESSLPLTRPTTIYPPSRKPIELPAFSPDDYTPTIAQAKAHQASLTAASQNKRLPSDAEIAAREQAREQALAAVQTVRVRVNLGDGWEVEGVFTAGETGAAVYAWLGEMVAEEGWVVRYYGDVGRMAVLPKGNTLVRGLGLVGGTRMVLGWEAGGRGKVTLRKEWREAPELRGVKRGVEDEVVEAPSKEEKPHAAPAKERSEASKASFEEKMKKMLFGKKR